MRSGFNGLFSSVMGIAALGLVASTAAQAGEFKTLNTESLAAGAQLQAFSSPKNTGAAMEMEVFEFRSAPVSAKYKCKILRNNTWRILNIRMIGVNGTVIAAGGCSAAAALGSSCTPPTPPTLVANLKFQCLVATANGSPVNASWYSMAVSR